MLCTLYLEPTCYTHKYIINKIYESWYEKIIKHSILLYFVQQRFYEST